MRKSDSPAARLGDRRFVPHRPARVGDVWRLGPHRLVCGDATDPAVVAIALKGAAPLLMVTDPPYGVEYDPAWRAQIIDRASGRSHIVWDKGRLIISRGHYHWRHEPCWYAVRKGKTAHWAGDRKQMTVWLIPHRRSETGHAAQKPVECMRRSIENHSRPGDCVYDPFVGSGTTIVAAELGRRICRAIEINPAYVDLAIARWETLTGRRARLVSCSS